MQWIHVWYEDLDDMVEHALSTPCNGFRSNTAVTHLLTSSTFQLHAMDSELERFFGAIVDIAVFQLHAMDSGHMVATNSPSLLSLFQLHAMDSLNPTRENSHPRGAGFQLHAMDSDPAYHRPGEAVELSTPCNGFESLTASKALLNSVRVFQLHAMDSVVSGDTFEVKDLLKRMGFRTFNSMQWIQTVSGAIGLQDVYFLSTPCNGFGSKALVPDDALTDLVFQLHAMDSVLSRGLAVLLLLAFNSMQWIQHHGGLVMVYYLVITGFYSVFYCCAPVFSAVGPPWS
jgi:hypothetical protein